MADCPERRLWTAVLCDQIVLAIREADMLRTGANPNAARRWIGSDDFREVCVLAGLDPDWVEKKAREQMALPPADRLAQQLRVGSVSSRVSMQRRNGLRMVAHHA